MMHKLVWDEAPGCGTRPTYLRCRRQGKVGVLLYHGFVHFISVGGTTSSLLGVDKFASPGVATINSSGVV